MSASPSSTQGSSSSGGSSSGGSSSGRSNSSHHSSSESSSGSGGSNSGSGSGLWQAASFVWRFLPLWCLALWSVLAVVVPDLDASARSIYWGDGVRYEDVAECSSWRVSPDTKRALEAYLVGPDRPDEETNRDGHGDGDGDGDGAFVYCGFESRRHFRSWSGMSSNAAPILFPRNDSEVQDFVRRIGDAGCRVRPIGSSQSESGIAISPMDDLSVGISLALYAAPRASNWSLTSLDAQELQQSKVVRSEAGHTLLRLHSAIRPLDFHLPTLPPNWSLTLGGCVASMAHGSTFGKSYLNSYVTRLRVALADGRILVLDEAMDLAMWRNSMGLIGLVLGVELQVEHRAFFSMGTRRTVVHQWNPWYLDAAVAGLLPGAAGAEYWFDPWTDEMIGVGVSTQAPGSGLFGGGQASVASASLHAAWSDADCTFDFLALRCNFPTMCEARFQLGDLLPAQACRLKQRANPTPEQQRDAYRSLEAAMEAGAVEGLPDLASPLGKLMDKAWDLRLESKSQRRREMHYSGDPATATAAATDAGGEATLGVEAMTGWMQDVADAVEEARAKLNDGFWLLAAPATFSLSYYFPAEKLFQALDIHRTLVRELVISEAPFQFRDSPLTFHFVRLDQKRVLQPWSAALQGDFVRVQIPMAVTRPGDASASADSHPNPDAWRYAIFELEQRWTDAFRRAAVPMFPGLSDVYGLHVFSSRNVTRQEALEGRYRRVKRVHDAFARIKDYHQRRLEERQLALEQQQQQRLERQQKKAGSSGGGFFSRSRSPDAGYGGSFFDHDEHAYDVDPSEEMFRRLQDDIAGAGTEADFVERQQDHLGAQQTVDQDDEFFGDLERELLEEAYVAAGGGFGAGDTEALVAAASATAGDGGAVNGYASGDGEAPAASLPLPFTDPAVVHGVFARDQMAAFLRYRQQLDPENRFWGGAAVRFFPKSLKLAAAPTDADALEEAQLILDIVRTAEEATHAGASRKNAVGTAALLAMSAYASYNVYKRLCARRKKRPRKRKRK